MTEIASSQPPNLFSRTIRGGMWISISRIVLVGVAFVRMIILGNLLGPREIGVLTMAMLFIEVLEVFTQTGFFTALVQRKENVEDFIHSAWTVAVTRGTILFIALFLLSPFIVHFFDSSGRFDALDFFKSRALANKIASDPNVLTQYLLNAFSETGRQKLRQSTALSDRELELLLVEELNSICQKDSIYTPQRFANISLSKYAVSEINDPKGSSVRLNRLLLEEAFPAEIKRRVLNIPQMTAVLRAVAVLFLIYGLNNSRLFQLTRNLDFDKIFYLQGTQTVCGFCLTVGLAFWLRNVWALVWGQLFSAVLGCILGYVLVPYHPRWDWNLHKAKQLWKFGRHITGVDILGFLIGRGDRFFAGKILGMTAMGHYSYASQMSYLVPDEIGYMISKISFPAYSQIQDYPQKICNGYHKSLQLISTVCFPVIGLLFVLAPLAIGVLLGTQWLPMIPAIRVLSLVAVVKGIQQSRSVFLGLNRPDIQMRLAITRFILLYALIYPLTQWFGITGTAMAVAGSLFMMFPMITYYTKKMIQSGYLDFFRQLRVPFISMIVMMGTLACLQYVFAGQSWLNLIGLTIFGFVVYILLLLFTDKYFNQSGIIYLVRDIFVTLRKSPEN